MRPCSAPSSILEPRAPKPGEPLKGFCGDWVRSVGIRFVGVGPYGIPHKSSSTTDMGVSRIEGLGFRVYSLELA